MEISLGETLLNKCESNCPVHTYRSYNQKLELHLITVEIQAFIQFKKAVHTYITQKIYYFTHMKGNFIPVLKHYATNTKRGVKVISMAA